MKKRRIIIFILIFIGVVFVVAALWGLYLLNTQSDLLGLPKALPPVAIQQYQGKNLSSIDDFKEVSISGPQHIDKQSYRLEIKGLVQDPISLSYEDIVAKHQSYTKAVTLNCVESWSATGKWEGVLVRDLLNEAKIKPEAKIVIFRAVDGYSTSFPVDYFYNNDIILAYKLNDQVLPEKLGFPFQLVAEDKWGYKWIKWATSIELSDHVNFQGYWESRGYSNSGNLHENYFNP
jgi:DMSO/TMAO reductase YedYZ molybdopterin-dependent catalytic subunit